eukprot:11797137-Ditylum_brightwellii.AAC.1
MIDEEIGNTYQKTQKKDEWGKVDAMDHFIKNMQAAYQSQKHWHSPKLHRTCMATVFAYDICLEVAEGEICST